MCQHMSLCVYMYIYIHIYICIYLHTHTHTYTVPCISAARTPNSNTYIHTHIQTDIHTYIHTYTHTQCHASRLRGRQIHIPSTPSDVFMLYIHTYIHTHTYIYTHALTYIHTYTRTHSAMNLGCEDAKFTYPPHHLMSLCCVVYGAFLLARSSHLQNKADKSDR